MAYITGDQALGWIISWTTSPGSEHYGVFRQYAGHTIDTCMPDKKRAKVALELAARDIGFLALAHWPTFSDDDDADEVTIPVLEASACARAKELARQIEEWDGEDMVLLPQPEWEDSLATLSIKRAVVVFKGYKWEFVSYAEPTTKSAAKT